jgi:hypothetical protein
VIADESVEKSRYNADFILVNMIFSSMPKAQMNSDLLSINLNEKTFA